MDDVHRGSTLPKHAVMRVQFTTKQDLHAAYMPFVKNGGLFVRTKKAFELGDEVFLLLTLLEEVEKCPVVGTVIWKTPVGAQSGMLAGIGLQFSEKSAAVHKKIETALVGVAFAAQPTDTM